MVEPLSTVRRHHSKGKDSVAALHAAAASVGNGCSMMKSEQQHQHQHQQHCRSGRSHGNSTVVDVVSVEWSSLPWFSGYRVGSNKGSSSSNKPLTHICSSRRKMVRAPSIALAWLLLAFLFVSLLFQTMWNPHHTSVGRTNQRHRTPSASLSSWLEEVRLAARASEQPQKNQTRTWQYDLINASSICHRVEQDNRNSCRIHFPETFHQGDAVFSSVSSSALSFSSSSCLVTYKGDKHGLPNQDHSVLLQTGPQEQLLALLDGHGELGHVTSAAAQVDLPWKIATRLRQQSASTATAAAATANMEQLLTDSFLEMDRDDSIRLIPHSGSTAVIILQQESTVYMATVGDSTAFCALWDMAITGTTSSSSSSMKNVSTVRILQQAVLHKPAHPVERARIEGAHGQVFVPSVEDLNAGASSRVIIPQHQQQSPRVSGSSESGPVIATVALAMSRSLGDEEGKVPGWLLAEPSIEVINLQEHDLDHVFCVAASDGLTDMIPVQQVANEIGQALYETTTTTTSDHREAGSMGATRNQLRATCHDLVGQAVVGWSSATGGTYRDDISLVVSKMLLPP